MTSTQKIPLTLQSNMYGSYEGLTESPTPANQFSGNQIILNSGRLVFNAKNDHIVLSADKSNFSNCFLCSQTLSISPFPPFALSSK